MATNQEEFKIKLTVDDSNSTNNINRTSNELVKMYSNMLQKAKENRKITEENTKATLNQAQAQAQVNKEMNNVNMSLGEMKKELMSLRNMSFDGLSPQKIAEIRGRMAELTDGIGDFQAQIKTASADSIPAVINGLQGIVAITQGVTSTMALFGVENKELEKKMVALIGASQALSTIYDLYEKNTLGVMWATIKKTYASIADTVATKAQTLATNGATVASRALGTAMKSIPFVAIVAAVAAVVVALGVYLKKVTSITGAQRTMREVNLKASESLVQERLTLEKLLTVAKDRNKSLEERKKAISEINKISPEYLGNITLENIETEAGTTAIYNYIEALKAKAKAQALEETLAEKYKELNRLEYEASIEYWNTLSEWDKYWKGSYVVFSNAKWDEINKMRQEIDDLIKIAGVTPPPNNDPPPPPPPHTVWTPPQDAEDIGRYFNEIVIEVNKGNETINKAFEEKNKEMEKKNEDFYKTLEENNAKYANREKERIEIRSELFKKTDSELYEERLNKLKYYLSQNIINEEEYAEKSKEIYVELFSGKDIMQRMSALFGDSEASKELANSVMGGFSELVDQMADSKNEKIEEMYEYQNELMEQNMEKELNAFGVTEEQKEIIKRKYEAKAKEKEKQKNIEMQKTALKTMVIDTALAIGNIWSKFAATPPIAIALSALATIPLAIQAAQIKKQKFKFGGLIAQGNSHANGGIVTPFGEIEGNEAIINKVSTKKYAGVLSAINVAGGGKELGQGGEELIDYERLASIIAGSINEQKVIVVSSDITKQQTRDSIITRKSTL